MGKRGGLRTRENQGSDFYRKIGEKGKQTLKERDPEFYKNFSRKGIEARRAKKQQQEQEQEEAKKSTVEKFTDILTGKR